MAKSMRVRLLTVALGLFSSLLSSGCAISPGGGLIAFPNADRLLPETQDARQPSPKALAVPRELEKTVIPAYIIEPGDVVLVQPADFDSTIRLPSDQTVMPDGTIDLGKYGQTVVAGLTIPQIRDLVQGIVEQAEAAEASNRAKQDAEDVPRVKIGPISARLVSAQSKVYYVLGEVNSPGAYPYTGRETVLDGLLAAGGLTERASMIDMVVSRPSYPCGCRVVMPICYEQIVQLGDTTTNYQVMPGDRIFIASRKPFQKKNKNFFCCGPQCPCPTVPPIEPQPHYAAPMTYTTYAANGGQGAEAIAGQGASSATGSLMPVGADAGQLPFESVAPAQSPLSTRGVIPQAPVEYQQ